MWSRSDRALTWCGEGAAGTISTAAGSQQRPWRLSDLYRAVQLFDTKEIDNDLWLVSNERHAGIPALALAFQWDPDDANILAALYLDRESWDLYRDVRTAELLLSWMSPSDDAHQGPLQSARSNAWILVLRNWPAVAIHQLFDVDSERRRVTFEMLNARIRRVEWILGPLLSGEGRRLRGEVPRDEGSPDDPKTRLLKKVYGTAEPLSPEAKQLPPERQMHAGDGVWADWWRERP
jgi:hypothetical protein